MSDDSDPFVFPTVSRRRPDGGPTIRIPSLSVPLFLLIPSVVILIPFRLTFLLLFGSEVWRSLHL